LNDLTIDIETIYIAHNIEYILYEKFVSKMKFEYFRNFFKNDVLKYQQYELNNINLLDKIITISSIDKSFLEKHAVDTKVLHLPVTFRYPRCNIENMKNNIINIAFLGSIDWWPNKEGILWFIKNVFLKINTTNVVLNIYGKNNNKLLNVFYKNINCYDYVDDISIIWKNNDIFIQPIFSGSGMNIKVAEALYNNKPLIATQFAMKGIDYKQKDGVYICNTPEEWSNIFNYDKLTEVSNGSISEEVIRNFDAQFQTEKLKQFLKMQI
jgi:glycosyltransferase involved in cell wall biosynthesis